MDKKEYFGLLLKRDFIRYVLLRQPRLSSKEVSQRLQRHIDVEQLNRNMKNAIGVTLDKYLALHKIMDESGDILTVLPDWLNPALVDDIVKEYQQTIENECDFSNLIYPLLAQIERLTWLQGVAEMAENLRKFLADIKKISKDYANIEAPTPKDYNLQEKYKAAKRITLKERILANNDEDVAVFRGALMAYAHSACETVLHKQLAKLYAYIADSSEIIALIAKFDKMAEDAKTEQASAKLPTHLSEWDTEYNTLVPVAFFERNIEEIDAAMAFHMVLLQAFARHEAILRKEALISDHGELSIFINGNLLNDKSLSPFF